jgi:hypothetical protein
MSNFAPINQELTYSSVNPSTNSFLNTKDVYRGNNATINFGMESREEYTPFNTTNLANIVLRGTMEDNEVSRLFFSEENIKRIQKKLKVEVFERSGGKFKLVEDQDESDLIVVMRYIYLDYGKNLPNEIVRQVKILNDKTINYMLPDILTNIKQYYGYIRDISNPITPLIRPMSTNANGRRALPSYTTLWK